MKLYEVIENKLYGSGLPSTVEEFARWKAFDSVVSLTEPFRLPFLKKMKYEEVFHVLHSEIPDFGAPSVEQGHLIVDWMHHEISKGNKVVVHCFIGRGRTGTLLAAYLIKYCNMTSQQAIAHVRSKNHEAIETRVQEEFVRSFV